LGIVPPNIKGFLGTPKKPDMADFLRSGFYAFFKVPKKEKIYFFSLFSNLGKNKTHTPQTLKGA